MKTPSLLRRVLLGAGIGALSFGCAAAPTGSTSNFSADQVGSLSYYSERGTIAFPRYRSSRGCAHKSLRPGTVIRLRYKGRTTTCVVDDRGPYVRGRIVDLQPAQFRQLAPLSAGVIRGVAIDY